MLNHEPTEQAQSEPSVSVPASDRRVTTEEFTQAVTALEAKREEVTKDLKGTVSIGATARELELDATPEEIWAEVQAQRRTATVPPDPVTVPAAMAPAPTPLAAAAPATPIPPPLHQTVVTSLRDAAVAAAPGLRDAASAAKPALQQGVHAVSDFVAQQKQNRKENKGKKRHGAEFGAVFGVIGVALLIAFNHGSPTVHIGGNPIVHISSSLPSTELLTSVQDGQQFSVDTATLEAIEHKTAPPSQLVYSSDLDDGWELVKHDGSLYVRGYTLPLSDQQLAAAPVKIYNNNNAGVLEDVNDWSVTLPLNGLHIDSTDKGETDKGNGWSELDISHVHADKYSREDW